MSINAFVEALKRKGIMPKQPMKKRYDQIGPQPWGWWLAPMPERCQASKNGYENAIGPAKRMMSPAKGHQGIRLAFIPGDLSPTAKDGDLPT